MVGNVKTKLHVAQQEECHFPQNTGSTGSPQYFDLIGDYWYMSRYMMFLHFRTNDYLHDVMLPSLGLALRLCSSLCLLTQGLLNFKFSVDFN